MRIRYVYGSDERQFETDRPEVVVGRLGLGKIPDLDLTPDRSVSRQHARLSLSGDELYVEDLGSGQGTLVGGEQIKGRGRRRAAPEEVIVVGRTRLHVEWRDAGEATNRATAVWSDGPGRITDSVDASSIQVDRWEVSSGVTSQRLALLCELPVQLGEQPEIGALLDLLLERVMELLPGAGHAALLLKEAGSDQLLLKAFRPQTRPVVSTTVCQRAMEQMQAVIWSADAGSEDAPPSIADNAIQCTLAAPLVWKGRALGVVTAAICDASARFDRQDLTLFVAAGQYAAAAVANQQLQDKLRRNASALRRLLVTFSPKVRKRLLNEAIAGRLRPGGRQTEVTILCSDIRGYAATSRDMETEDVVDMLNEYFSTLVHCVFQFDGTIDKFVGDSILAVFGSPQRDKQQYEKAVRAAAAMQEAMQRVSAERRGRGQVTCEIGIGVHCGEVLHGFIGSTERMEFTVIGDAVNLTTRYCDAAEPGQILISPALYEHVWRLVETEQTTIPAKHEGELDAYVLTGVRAEA